MPRRSLLAFFLLLSLAFNGCFAQQRIGQQQHIKAARPSCNIERITARQPTILIPSEAGVTEFWDSNTPEFECAVVEVERLTVETHGLVLPYYSNAAKIYYVIQGRAIQGTVVPGCAETFESPVQGARGQQGQSPVDRHQKLVRVTQGDVVAQVAGHTHWIYNDGNVPLILVAVADLANQANQLDLQYRRFWLAGNSQNQEQQGQGQGQRGQGQQEQQGQGEHGHGQPGQGQQQQGQGQRGQGQQEQQQEQQGQGEHGQGQPGQGQQQQGQGQRGQGQQEQQGQGEHGQGQPGQGQQQQGQGQQGQGQQEWGEYENIWNGFDDEILSNILRVSQEIVRKLKGQQSNRRGSIVRAENLQLSLPEFDQQERQQQQQPGSGSGPNGLEETICTLKIRENIAHPARADIYNPRAGRLSTVNSQTLPILDVLGLSALHANLYSNALWAPSWTSNANTVLYVIRGSARVQIVGATGSSVFDGELNRGELIIVPQNFVVLKKAGDQGLEFIAFKNSDNALTSSLAGRLSALRALPEDIIAAAFRIPKGEVRRLKYGREEALLLSGSESQGRRADA